MKQFRILLLTLVLAIAGSSTQAFDKNNDAVLFFSGTLSGNQQVYLTWRTGILLQEQGFDVERQDASGVWHKIGFIKNGDQAEGVVNYSFIDPAPVSGKNFYRLRHWLPEGSSTYSRTVMVEFLKGTQGLSFQNYPNPFVETTLIRYEIAMRGPVRIVVMDITGLQLAQLVNKQDEVPGTYTVQWNGRGYPPGTYIYKIMTAGGTVTQKMIKAR